MSRFVVHGTGGSLYLLEEWGFCPIVRKRIARASWVKKEDATAFLSEQDAWAAFDRSGCGKRADYAVVEQ